jgi:hypothetical protein
MEVIKMSKVKNKKILLKEVFNPKENDILLSQIKELDEKLEKIGIKGEEITLEEINRIMSKVSPLSPIISEMRR